MNSSNDKSSLDRTLGSGKPVDPATRLSELLAQSLEELTRPFDPPRPGPARPAGEGADTGQPGQDSAPEQTPEESRLDADKALAELEAELFAAAKNVERDPPAQAPAEPAADQAETPPAEEPVAAQEGDTGGKADDAPNESDIVPPPLVPEQGEPKPDAAAAAVIAKVRRLMLVSMAVTVIAVGSVFGFIGYRIFKSDGTTAKTADKLPEASAIPVDMTLALPRGARVIQSAVAGDRLVVTLSIDGRIEVRTFDVNTLQPAGRLNFSGTP